jgi:hypothetical protein
MLEHRLDAARSILYLRPAGPLQKEDFAQLAATVDPHIEAKGGLAGIVLDIKAFPGWEASAPLARSSPRTSSRRRSGISPPARCRRPNSG